MEKTDSKDMDREWAHLMLALVAVAVQDMFPDVIGGSFDLSGFDRSYQSKGGKNK
jgi:hypothetical protein